jgi:hypothetical protein
MVATRRLRFDSSLERIMELVLKNSLAGEAGVRGFSRFGEGSFFLMKTRGFYPFSS